MSRLVTRPRIAPLDPHPVLVRLCVWCSLKFAGVKAGPLGGLISEIFSNRVHFPRKALRFPPGRIHARALEGADLVSRSPYLIHVEDRLSDGKVGGERFMKWQDAVNKWYDEIVMGMMDHDLRVAIENKANFLAVQKEIEESPDRVAYALEKLSMTKDVKWGTRRKIKRDLQSFWILADRAQKIEFPGRAVFTYGPMVLSALRGLL